MSIEQAVAITAKLYEVRKCEGISLTFSAWEDLGDGMISVPCDIMHRFRLRLKTGESSEDVCKSLENLAKFIREDLNAK